MSEHRDVWHIRAVVLPDTSEPADFWVCDGVVGREPVDGAQDVPGAFVLPGGLVDAHVHLTMNFGKVMPHADGSEALMSANAAAHRRSGVLAFRDAGCAWGGVPTQLADGPRLQRAGRLLAPPGRGYPNVCHFVDAESLVIAALEDVRAGAAWVKIIGDFPGPDGNWFAAPPTYSRDVLKTLVSAVHADGARVMAHSTGLGAPDLVAAGVDSIEHGMVLTPDLVREMADRQVAWVLTLATAHKHLGTLVDQQSPVGAYVRGQLDRIRHLLPEAHARGVPILAGSDEVRVGTFVDELHWITRFGLSADQALRAASTNARAWLGFAPAGAGGCADFVTYLHDPREDVSALREPAAVVVRGRLLAAAV